MKSALLFFLLYYASLLRAEHPCKEYSECRLDLLSKRFSCLEQPRKAVEQTCKLKDDFNALWKSSLWKEKLMVSCLSEVDTQSSSTFCFHSPNFNMNVTEKCGISLKLIEERCELLKNCCRISQKCIAQTKSATVTKELQYRTQLAIEKAVSCSRKIYAAIQSNMTAEDVLIARSIVRRTSTIRDLLVSFTESQVIPPFAPFPPKTPKYTKEEIAKLPKRLQGIKSWPLENVDNDSRSMRTFPILTEKRRLLNVHTTRFLNDTSANIVEVKSKQPAFKNQLKQKTLFTQLLHKRRGIMKPWKGARIRSVSNQAIPGLPAFRLNTSHIINTYTFPVPAKEQVWKGKIEELKPIKILRENKKTTETTLKPVYLALKYVDRRKNGWKKWEWDKSEAYREFKSSLKSSSEEDFDAEFEKKAGTLVSFGPNALPLPGTKKIKRVNDPFQDIVEKHELTSANVSDITTRAPIMRPKLRLSTVSSPFPQLNLPAPRPAVPTTKYPWDPLFSFFSTPAPFYLSTAIPIQLWPFKAVRAAKTFRNESKADEELPLNPVESAVFTQSTTPLEAAPLNENLTTELMETVDSAVEIAVSRETTASPVEFVSTEKGYCVKYQTCLRILDEAERECETKTQAQTKAPQQNQRGNQLRKSVCLNLDKKFQITELVKTIQTAYRKCIWNDTESYNKGGEECGELPTLPIDYYLYKTCNKKVIQLRKHCEMTSKCCTATEKCQALSAASTAESELKLKRRRLETLKIRCQQKNKPYTNSFGKTTTPVPKIEGEAKVES